MKLVIAATELKDLHSSKSINIIDVRDKVSYDRSHILNAIHLESASLPSMCNSLDKATPAVIYCYHGVSSLRVAEIFRDLGFNEVYSLEGGYTQWANENA